MDMQEICPCPKLNCPNHGCCDQCVSRHVRKGSLNYCAFHTLLPTLRQVVAADPESPAAKKLDGLIGAQLRAYEKLMHEHGLSQERQAGLLKAMAEYGDRKVSN